MPSVYVLQAEGTPRVKIGYSDRLLKRCQEVDWQSPYPVVVLRAIETVQPQLLETLLHQRYVVYQRYREWFELPVLALLALLREDFTWFDRVEGPAMFDPVMCPMLPQMEEEPEAVWEPVVRLRAWLELVRQGQAEVSVPFHTNDALRYGMGLPETKWTRSVKDTCGKAIGRAGWVSKATRTGSLVQRLWHRPGPPVPRHLEPLADCVIETNALL